MGKKWHKNFFPKIIYPKSISSDFLKAFSPRAVARWGHLGMFVCPWRTLGGTDGTHFYAKNILEKIIYPKKNFFWNFSQNFFSSCCGPMGTFRDLCVPLSDARGYWGETLLRENFSPKIIKPKNIFFGIFLKTFSPRVVVRWGHLGILVCPWWTLEGTEGNNFYAKKILQKSYIRKKIVRNFSQNFFSSCCGPMGTFRDLCMPLVDARGYWGEQFLRKKNSPKIIYPKKIVWIFSQNFFSSCCGPMGTFRDLCMPLVDAMGTEGKNCYAKKISKNHISETKLFGIFSQNFFPRVVARWGHLGIFVCRWRTLGSTEGKNFYAKNFLQKLYIRKIFFRNFSQNFFSSCCGPMGAFMDLSVPLVDARGYWGEQFLRKKISPKIIYPKKIVRIFSQNFFSSCCGPMGTFRDLCMPLVDARFTEGKIVTQKILKNHISETKLFGIFLKTFFLVLWPDGDIYGSLCAAGGR